MDIGEHAAPSKFLVIDEIPETMTGKYMRRIVQKIVQGRDFGDISSLRNPDSIASVEKAVRSL